VRDAEVHAAAAREHLVADRLGHRIGILLRLRVRDAKATLTCIGPPVRTGLRSAKNVRPSGTRSIMSSKTSLSSRSVFAASMRSR
jgi:hypothetical protein